MLMNGRTKLVWGALFVLGFGLTYSWPNHFPHSTPRLLPLTDWERSLPLLPWTFLVYLSDYPMGVWAVWLVRREKDFLAMARVATIAMCLSGLVFHLFPTVYPRPPYPDQVSWVSRWAMAILGSNDRPNCAFPSMHVAMTAACVWGVRNSVPRRLFPAIVLWGVAIAVSTLTTKQHYLWDVIGGAGVFATALAAHLVLERRFGRKAWPDWMFVGGRGLPSVPPLPFPTAHVLPNGDSGLHADSDSRSRAGNSRSTRSR